MSDEAVVVSAPQRRLSDTVGAVGPGDQTGTETLGRYVYQCKVALQKWLQTLDMSEGARVLCEFVDDIATDTGHVIEFAQVKTRDRGAWSASKVLAAGGGIDALIRSYNHAKAAGVVSDARFELILEGPEGDGQDTRAFFEDPTSATTKQRAALAKLGLAAADVADFLERLTITPQFYSRHSIDAVGKNLLTSIVGGHSSDIADLYDALLKRVVDAHLGLAGSADPANPSVLKPPSDSDADGVVQQHELTREVLVGLLPPVPALAEEQRRLLEAANGGALAMTALEFKLVVAGAGQTTIDRAKSRRSAAVVAIELRRGQGSFDAGLEALGDRVLEHAEAVTMDISALAPTVERRTRPADAVYGRLVQQRAALGGLDSNGLLDGDGDLVLGLLCDLSDQCRFPWRTS